MRSLDTSPEAHAQQLEAYRRMTYAQKAELVVEITEQIWSITAEGVRRRHPDYDEQAVNWALYRKRVGDELFRKAWPEAPLLAL